MFVYVASVNIMNTFYSGLLIYVDNIIQKTYVHSLNFADDQVLLAQDHDDMEYMARN